MNAVEPTADELKQFISVFSLLNAHEAGFREFRSFEHTDEEHAAVMKTMRWLRNKAGQAA